MPFNPFLDDDGDGTWSDIEAETDSQHGVTSQHPESSASPSPRLRAQIIELDSEASDGEENTAENTNIVPSEDVTIATVEQEHGNVEHSGDAILLLDREDPESPENINLLNEFIKSPVKVEGPDVDSIAGREPRDPLHDAIAHGEVAGATIIEETSLGCERCLKMNRQCDGIEPRCGWCVIHKKRCTWPATEISRADFYRVEQARRATSSIASSSSAMPTPRKVPDTNSATPKSGSTPTRFHREMEQTLDRLAQRNSDLNPQAQHNKDLLFSDILPEPELHGDSDSREVSQRRVHTLQYLDLCDSDSSGPPSLDNPCHHCTVGKRRDCKGERPCQSCSKHGRQCFDYNPNRRKKFFPRRGNKVRTSDRLEEHRLMDSIKKSSTEQNTYVETGDTTETDPDVSERDIEQSRIVTSALHSEYQPRPYDDALIRGKQQGLTSEKIKKRMHLRESTLTLRGRWLQLVRWGVVEPIPTLNDHRFLPTGAKPPISDRKSEVAAYRGAQDSPSLPPGPQAKLRWDCRPCKQNGRRCNRELPCKACVDHGSGQKCCFTGGSGGGGGSARHLYQSEEQGPASIAHSPIANQIPNIRMVNADPSDTRVVFCNQCTKCHKTCDTMLPCDRCQIRGIGHLCSYSARYVPATDPLSKAQTALMDLKLPAASDNGRTAQTDSGYSTLSPITSALLVETRPRGSPSKATAQPLTRHIISDSDSDDDAFADIVHEDETETIQVSRSNRPTPTVRDSIAQLLKSREGQSTSNAHKRKASEVFSTLDIAGFQQSSHKRVRRGSEEAPWRPSGGAKSTVRRREVRPATRLSTSTIDRRPYTGSPTTAPLRKPLEGFSKDDPAPVPPEEVPSIVREVFANMSKDVFLDILPETSGPGAKAFKRLGVSMKQPDEYSMSVLAVRNRERRAEMSDLEAMLEVREKSDTDAKRRVTRAAAQDPLTQWESMSEAQQEDLRQARNSAIMKRRDDDGRSANYFANQILKLATSCVGETAMLQYLMQSRKARLKVMSIFDDLVKLEEDGRLRLIAGKGHDMGDVGPATSLTDDEDDLEISSLSCEWQGCTRCFGTRDGLEEHLSHYHVARHFDAASQFVCKWRGCTFVGSVNRGSIVKHIRSHLPAVKMQMFECRICGWCYETAPGLAEHELIHDKHESDHQETQNEARRRSPSASLADPQGPPVQCKWYGCSKSFDNSFSLFTHVSEDHVGRRANGDFTLTCRWGTCSFSAKYQRSHMVQHVHCHIPNFKPFPCTICGKKFDWTWRCIEHASMHEAKEEDDEEKEKEVQLDLSEWGARSAPKFSGVREYRRGQDTDDEHARPFQCHSCGRGFMTAQGFGKHMKMHEGAAQEHGDEEEAGYL